MKSEKYSIWFAQWSRYEGALMRYVQNVMERWERWRLKNCVCWSESTTVMRAFTSMSLYPYIDAERFRHGHNWLSTLKRKHISIPWKYLDLGRLDCFWDLSPDHCPKIADVPLRHGKVYLRCYQFTSITSSSIHVMVICDIGKHFSTSSRSIAIQIFINLYWDRLSSSFIKCVHFQWGVHVTCVRIPVYI